MDIHMADQVAREIINNRDRARVMLLGTFHFDAPGMDELNLKIDMTTEQRQTERGCTPSRGFSTYEDCCRGASGGEGKAE